MNLVEKLLKGDEKSAARLISLIENGAEAGFKAVESIFPYTGKAYILGITGPPGAGKSTLIDKIALRFAKENKKIGVIAVDPSSIHNKGAFLGDRVRMKEAEKITARAGLKYLVGEISISNRRALRTAIKGFKMVPERIQLVKKVEISDSDCSGG